MEADGEANQKTVLKQLSWPAMDEADALPSSYIPKVLSCLSKWSVRMQSMLEVFNAQEQSDNIDMPLN